MSHISKKCSKLIFEFILFSEKTRQSLAGLDLSANMSLLTAQLTNLSLANSTFSRSSVKVRDSLVRRPSAFRTALGLDDISEVNSSGSEQDSKNHHFG